MPETTQEALERAGLIPVLRAHTAAQAHALVTAGTAGGITVIEVTMTVPGAVDLLKDLKQEYGSTLLLGAGTVTSVEEVDATVDAGAEFIVSPTFYPEVVARTLALGKVAIPGALTPSEIITAWNSGAHFVKVFPCSAMGGASYLKALLAPFPYLKLIPTGGVTLQTAESFLRAGARALGVGKDLLSLTYIEEGAPERITETARAYLDVVDYVRAGSAPAPIVL